MTLTIHPAHIYKRRNGEYGSSCDGIQDTGHVIIEVEPDLYDVYPVGGGDDVPLVRNATRRAAELVIAQDWRAPK